MRRAHNDRAGVDAGLPFCLHIENPRSGTTQRWRPNASARICKQVPRTATRSTEKLSAPVFTTLSIGAFQIISCPE
jgi:hypothetical protein